nr:thiamine pyrophosphate-requiring protein [Tomitella gaofuii]
MTDSREEMGTAMQTTAEFIIGRLREWGIHRIFGYPGDGILAMLDALNKADGDPELIQTRHEEMAAFMATGHTKFTGEIGCCLATSGGGAIHLLNGLYDAKLDHQPVVALVGQQKRMSLGAAFQQEIDPNTLYKDVSSDFVQTCMAPAQARHLVDRACKVALTNRTVATIILPEDVGESEAVPSPPRMHGAVFSGVGWTRPRMIPPVSELDKAAEILNSGNKVAMLVGHGAAEAADQVVEAAELLGAGVAKTSLGRATLPDDLPYVTGPIGLLGSTASDAMMRGADTLFMVGTAFPYTEWLPEEGQCRGVEINADGRMIGTRYPMEANLVGDSVSTLDELLPKLKRKKDRSWREHIESQVDEWWKVLDDRAHDKAEPLNPELVAHELSKRLPDEAVITADAGSVANWWARHLRMRPGMGASLAGNLATMGPGTPYAIATKLAYPTRPVIAMIGDGVFQMNGMAEMITIKRYLDRFTKGGPLVFCVFNNQDLNQVTFEQRAQGADPKFEGSQNIPDVPYAEFASMLGLTGIRCDSPDDIGAAWDRALATDGPVVLEVVVDPEIPPVPPHMKKEMVKKTAKAMVDDPQKVGVAAKGAKQKLHEFTESAKQYLPGETEKPESD